MIVAHIMGIPVEENIGQLAPAGAVLITAFAISVRTTLDRLRGSRGSRKTPRRTNH